MVIENRYKIVKFDKYCKNCQYEELPEYESPCNECLDQPANVNTVIPMFYKEQS